MFQSSLSYKTECNSTCPDTRLSVSEFQSSLSYKTECNSPASPSQLPPSTFQSSLSYKTECNATTAADASTATWSFNPHSVIKLSATSSPTCPWSASPGSFNPHSVIKLSATLYAQRKAQLQEEFQSSLSYKTECNAGRGGRPHPAHRSFNPHSVIKLSATRPARPSRLARHGFNPHSVIKLSATVMARLAREGVIRFQSSLSYKTECNAGMDGATWAVAGVSILTQL